MASQIGDLFQLSTTGELGKLFEIAPSTTTAWCAGGRKDIGFVRAGTGDCSSPALPVTPCRSRSRVTPVPPPGPNFFRVDETLESASDLHVRHAGVGKVIGRASLW
jgi:hypothetical protein